MSQVKEGQWLLVSCHPHILAPFAPLATCPFQLGRAVVDSPDTPTSCSKGGLWLVFLTHALAVCGCRCGYLMGGPPDDRLHARGIPVYPLYLCVALLDMVGCTVAACFKQVYRGVVWCRWRRTVSCSCLLPPLLIAVCVGSLALLGLWFPFRVAHVDIEFMVTRSPVTKRGLT